MPTAGETPYIDRKEIEGVQQFTEEEQRAIQHRIKTMREVFSSDSRAKYKIELFFGEARSLHKPTPGIVSFWESGSKFHGGGDSKIYICPSKMKKMGECQATMPDAGNGSGVIFCPACGTTWKGTEVIGEHIARLSMRNWAQVLLHYFVRMEHNADIYLKYAKDDIRTAAMLEQAKDKGGDVLRKVRDRRAQSIYPLANIIKDTSAGADLLGRMYSFLSA